MRSSLFEYETLFVTFALLMFYFVALSSHVRCWLISSSPSSSVWATRCAGRSVTRERNKNKSDFPLPLRCSPKLPAYLWRIAFVSLWPSVSTSWSSSFCFSLDSLCWRWDSDVWVSSLAFHGQPVLPTSITYRFWSTLASSVQRQLFSLIG